MRVIIVQPSGSTQAIEVEPSYTVRELKDKIQTKLGVNMSKYILNYGTLDLDDETNDKTLEDIDLKDEGMIHITSIVKGGLIF